ncbi:uncharacterized protein IUM83_18102 [Phytophthora cinnamomi]|uniref:uncharacterized protein n=1 Tax=Phytophthora cinnamomi TaxID=4785 RepID=UPI0035594A1D|nr:hypothetical protein IUM83_18102 [Phytophthora cinnamomi]
MKREVELSQDQELCQDRTLQVLDRALHDYEASALWALGTNNPRRIGSARLEEAPVADGFGHELLAGRLAVRNDSVKPSRDEAAGSAVGHRSCQRGRRRRGATPTQEEPFRFMGVMRYVTTVSKFRRPREFVLACARGDVTAASGAARLPDGSVGVYYKLIVDAKTIMPDSVVHTAIWKAVQRFWELAPRCIETKKLSCCVENARCTFPTCKQSLSSVTTSLTHGTARNSSTQTYWCVLCTSWLCSKANCCEIRQLVRVDRATLEVHQQNVTLCAKCARLIRRKSASEMARCALQHERPQMSS